MPIDPQRAGGRSRYRVCAMMVWTLADGYAVVPDLNLSTSPAVSLGFNAHVRVDGRSRNTIFMVVRDLRWPTPR